jgi:hypothetical protein
MPCQDTGDNLAGVSDDADWVWAALLDDEEIECHRCGLRVPLLDREAAGFALIHAEDDWYIAACPDCQREDERVGGL